MSAVQRIRLFVYGTLMRKGPRANLMSGAVFERSTMTHSGYALHDLGEYPALVVAAEGVVGGEVYSVTIEHLATLDRYEGFPELYGRQNVVLADGTEAVAYVMPADRASAYPRIESGAWKPLG